MLPLICPSCGNVDTLREVLRVEVLDQGYGRMASVEFVDVRCISCDYIDPDGEGAL